MTEEQHTEIETSEGGESGSSEDNELIRSLRSQLKEKDKLLKATPNVADLEEQAYTKAKRRVDIESQLVGLGQPQAVRKLIEEKLEEAEAIDREVVAEALRAEGFNIADEPEGGDGSQRASENLGDVSALSNQVANASKNEPGDDLTERINNAQTPEEVAQIMREADLGT